ncbi:hypothetical protein SAMN05421837_114117 [Amycolatopsis pretoriensis]|uniref:Uncharacterized protein n=1 Tax=Amycolatopsis pretoriensis TaxID=218821 RepID=A0A1H5RJ49_9PSEU|nr:hypothetical protein [Amycolatopsis pretoriensis]SEF37557.1 hypothetical protein SAMN05421837_114117 [Amycolatopsis pretoriensis]
MRAVSGVARRTGLRRPAPEDGAARTKAGASQAVKVIASVAANLALSSALLYFFGLVYTQRFFGYFRVHYTVLDQAAEEVLARGAFGLHLPIGAAAGTGLVLFGLVRLARFLLPARIRARLARFGPPVATIAGLALVGVTVPVVLDPDLFGWYPGLPGLAFAVGVVLAVVGWRRLVPGTHTPAFLVAEWLTTYLLVAFGLFWAVSDYSAQVGVREAFTTAARIPSLPGVTVYSERSLNLEADGVRQVVCGQPEAAYKYRYTGLKLLLQSGGQYVFVTARWRASNGVTFVVPRSAALRLEFAPPGTKPSGAC